MNKTFRLAFASEKLELSWFELSENGLVPVEAVVKDRHDVDNILVLPALAGLPFQIELPFSAPEKIGKVVPQFVADIYPEIDENWLFSWSIAAAAVTVDKTVWRVSGVAFPPEFAPQRLSSATRWRLAIPDTALVNAQACAAYRLTSPVHSFIVVFSEKDQVARIVRDLNIPLAPVLAAAGIEAVRDFTLCDLPGSVFQKVNELLDDASCLDLSGWHQQKKAKRLRWATACLVALLTGLVFIGHFFIWFECHLNERAAERTYGYVSTAFAKVFPGTPMIDAVSQIKRKITEAGSSIREAGALPDIRWPDIVELAIVGGDHGIKMLKVVGRNRGVRCQGLARDFTSLEGFRRRLSEDSRIAVVSMPESRKSGEEVLFVLEAEWKQ